MNSIQVVFLQTLLTIPSGKKAAQSVMTFYTFLYEFSSP